MKTGMETLHGIRYNLQMMSLPLTRPYYIYIHNISIVHKTQILESNLKKKKNSICYHEMRESAAMVECITYKIPTNFNLDDILTQKLLGQKKRGMVEGVMYEVFD